MDPNKLDYSHLSRNYKSSELYQYMRQDYLKNNTTFGVVIILCAMFLASFAIPMIFMLYVIVAALLPADTPLFVRAVLSLLLSGGLGLFIPFAIWRVIARSLQESLRIKTFAEANNIQYLNGQPSGQPGVLFQYGHTRSFAPALALPGKVGAMFGNYKYVTGSGKNQRTHRNGFVRCQLARKLPHVLLDATSNNFIKMISNLGSFDANQRIELEGDFNEYFNVYTPSGYGRDALYWLTPELMELLKNHMNTYDIEVVDNYVYAYSATPFKINEQTIKALLTLVNWLDYQFEQNTRRYSDERVGSFMANVVSQPGRRLKRHVSWLAIAGVVFYIILRVGLEILRP